MRRIVLTEAQMREGRKVGLARFEQAKGDPRFAYDTTALSGQKTHIVGAQAELAFAASLGLKWPARVDTFRELPDVDPNWEVRWTPAGNRLVKVATDDDPGVLVATVTGTPPVFDIIGYVVAGPIQQRYPARDLGNRGWKAHFAPLSVLAPIDDDFHELHGWSEWEPGVWLCFACGAEFVP